MSKRATHVAEQIRENVSECLLETVEPTYCDTDEVYAKTESISSMDEVIAVAYDHNYVPIGMIEGYDGETAASRFVPREQFPK